MFNRACLLASRAKKLFHAIDSATRQSALVEVGYQWIKAFVLRQDNAGCLGSSLKGSTQMKGYVKVQGILAIAFNFLKLDSGELMCS